MGVMSQSDSDYRDESCQNREFRANVRQVGNSVTHCGPGQLPDTDNKRCSWNWNYNSHSFTGDNDTHNGETTGNGGIVWNAPSAQNPLDAEEWFDRNDPHSFDMWSTRKRRAVANDRKYAFNMGYWGAQEGATGDGSNMFNGQVFDSENQFHANAIQIPISDFNFNLIFKNADDEVPPMTVEINTDFCFSPSNAAGCTACVPSAAEFNQAGFVDVNGEAVTISADTYAADVAALSGLYHETACGGSDHTVGATTYKTCTPAEISLMQATTHLGSTTVCDSNNGNSYKAENGKGGFRQLTNAQTLTFDDPRIKSALNPTSKISQTLKLRETIFPNVSLEMKSGSLLPMDPLSLEHIQLVQQFQLHTIFLTTPTSQLGSHLWRFRRHQSISPKVNCCQQIK